MADHIAVGTPVTIHVGSDCYPGKVVRVVSRRCIEVTKVEFTAGEGHDYFGKQVWVVHHDRPDGCIRTYTLRINGEWVHEGESAHRRQALVIGYARAYQDPHF